MWNLPNLLQRLFSSICKWWLILCDDVVSRDRTVLTPEDSQSKFCLQQTCTYLDDLLKSHTVWMAVREQEVHLDYCLLLQCPKALAPDTHCWHRLGFHFELLTRSFFHVGKRIRHETAVLVDHAAFRAIDYFSGLLFCSSTLLISSFVLLLLLNASLCFHLMSQRFYVEYITYSYFNSLPVFGCALLASNRLVILLHGLLLPATVSLILS